MKVLIVDDERAIRNSLGEILSDEGYTVDKAEDGTTGYEMIGKEHYDVIFCDIKMPGMDGLELLDKISADGVDTPIVMIPPIVFSRTAPFFIEAKSSISLTSSSVKLSILRKYLS